MPCNSVSTSTVELEKLPDFDLLEAALTSEFTHTYRAGGRFVFTADGKQVVLENGRATSRLPEAQLGAVVGRVKQALTREAIKAAAKRFGWTVTKGTDANHFAITKG
jgi:hypothetical protein